jgi:MIP family channel proteins
MSGMQKQKPGDISGEMTATPLTGEKDKDRFKQVNKPVTQKNSIGFQGFNIKRFLMEFIGSFAIVYFGNWAQIFCDLGKSNLTAVALTVGITMTIFTWIGSHISGAHFNPVTTMSMIFLKRIGWSTGLIYWVFQLLGGMIAGAMIYLQVPPELFKSLKRLNGLGLPTPDKRFTTESIWTEMIATFFFQIAVMSLHLDKRAPKDVYAIGTGAMMTLGILTIGNISGGGINPARVFGPSIITGDLSADIFIFIVGPMLGSLLAAFLYREVFIQKKKPRVQDDDGDSDQEIEDDLKKDIEDDDYEQIEESGAIDVDEQDKDNGVDKASKSEKLKEMFEGKKPIFEQKGEE